MENISVGDMQEREGKRVWQCLEGTTTMAQSQQFSSPPSNVSATRRRGRPLGSKNRRTVALGNGFTPQVIVVNRGENVLEKISTISMEGSSRATILSANGSICSVTIRHPGSSNNMLYKGSFTMISLSGSFGVTESNGVGSNLNILFGGVNGCVYGGEVTGPIIADGCIQVVIATYNLHLPKKQRKASVNKCLAIVLPSTSSAGT